MSECWFKHHEGMVDDAKFDLVAEIAEVPLSLVSIGWAKLLEFAAKQDDRGSVAGFDPRLISARFKEYTADQVRRVLAALREVGSIVGERIAAWVRRGNPARFAEAAVNDNAPRSARKSTPRTRKHRAERRAASQQLSLLLPMSGGVPAPSGTPVPTPPGTPKDDDISNSSPDKAAPEKREDSERSLETESSCSNAVPSKTVLNNSKNEEGVSRRTAPLDLDDDLAPTRRAKRLNMLKTLRRWVLSSPHQTEPDRADYLAMLGRAEYALDEWNSRSLVDKHWLDELKRKADRLPLDDQTVTFHHMAEHGGVYRSKRFWKRAMAATEAAHAAAGMPEMPFATP